MCSKDICPAEEKRRARTWFWFWAKRNPCVASLLSTRACIMGFQHLLYCFQYSYLSSPSRVHRNWKQMRARNKASSLVLWDVTKLDYCPCLIMCAVLKPRERRPCSKVGRHPCATDGWTTEWSKQSHQPASTTYWDSLTAVVQRTQAIYYGLVQFLLDMFTSYLIEYLIYKY